MRMFKKLQENSLYWRYRFITRRWLGMKRWWRERRSPRPYPVGSMRMRAMAAASPYTRNARAAFDARRGVAFVLVLAAALTALQRAVPSTAGLAFGVLFLAVVLAVTYLFARFW